MKFANVRMFLRFIINSVLDKGNKEFRTLLYLAL